MSWAKSFGLSYGRSTSRERGVESRILTLIGAGLASAVLIDVTIVRMVLVPALMQLLGERNWSAALADRAVPRLRLEPEAQPARG